MKKDFSRLLREIRRELLGKKYAYVPPKPKANQAFVVILNGYRQEGWQSVMEIWKFIKKHKEIKSWHLPLENQDPQGKWTMKLIIETKSASDYLKREIGKKAKDITPGVGVSYEDI